MDQDCLVINAFNQVKYQVRICKEKVSPGFIQVQSHEFAVVS